MKPTYQLAHAAGWDAGNALMRKLGLPSWDAACYAEASATFNLIIPATDRQWRVRGQGQNGLAELIVCAVDHNAAIRAASRRRVRVESCVLVSGNAP